MKSAITILLLLCSLNSISQTENKATSQKHLNVYVISKSEKFELFPFTVKVRAFVKSIFSKKRMRVIVADKSVTAANKIEKLMHKYHAVIGNIWFDSHGLYRNGFSSFSIGQDHFSYKNINDTIHTTSLRKIAAFTDADTKVGIGSCYGGATFTFPGSATVKSGPMNGDSLMIGMGKIFYGSTIYASSGWVMMKPGIFSDNYGFAGYPLGKKYKTVYWRPVWDHLGEWYTYSTTDCCIKKVNTVALNRIGEIKIRSRNYLSLAKAVRKQSRTLTALQI